MVFNKMIYLVTSIQNAPARYWELKQYLSAVSVSTNEGESNISIIYLTENNCSALPLPHLPAVRNQFEFYVAH